MTFCAKGVAYWSDPRGARQRMKQTFEEYRFEVEENAERFAQTQETHNQEDHLRAFNLGRMVERIQNPRRRARRPVRWLLAGLVIGVLCGRVFPASVYRSFGGGVPTRASIVLKAAGMARAR